MLDLDKAVFDLRNGSITLKDILEESSNLTHRDQFKLVLSDQYYRISQGLPCDANHYLGIVPWIANSPGHAIEIIVWQLSPELKNANLAILQDELTRQLELIGSEYKPQLDQALEEWRFALPDDDELDRLASEFETRREQGETPRIELWLLLVPPAHRGKFLMRLIDIEAFQLRRQNASIDWPSFLARFPEYVAEVSRAEKQLGKSSEPDQSNRGIREIFETASSEISTKLYEPGIQKGMLFRGRFHIEKEIGRGNFGRVLLALDHMINRYVAIKIANKESSQTQAYKPEDQIKEARLCGSLDHPNIVPVYDADVLESGGYFIVSRFIDGGTLKNEIEKDDIELRRIATLIESIASALHAVHRKGIIHRDIKPANILIERESQKAYVTDFGLATSEEDLKEKRKRAGSTPYKSPEQIRAEGHRLSGRSDLFSLGTMMYEMLCGTRPFQGSSLEQIEKQILDYDPPNPMTLKPEVPLELDRICMKLLRKNQYERYADGQEVSRDLNEWLTSEETPNTTRPVGPVAIKPRGLRSFTENDSDFFLELLPGFRDRYGIPECVSFWTDKIHTSDPAKTFPVGMIMGPSGSGKSSLVKAGIIPLLQKVTSVHLEASPEDTETRLLDALKTKLPYLDDTASLTEALFRVRRSCGQKVVIFVDQFEQWLSANQPGKLSELSLALRQCDGGKLQAVLIVRDDFGPATRYITNDLDFNIDPQRNYAAVDLFEPQHAKKVLIKFGQAFGKFPERAELLSSNQSDFIDQVIEVFLRDGKDKGVIPVQLALFAEMIKTKPWETQTLERLGGPTGILGNFLDDAFGELNPQNRPHEVAAREALKALLPPVGGYLKGHGISKHELMETCGYLGKPAEFRSLLGLLDGRLRLIKTAMEQQEVYQLTHDYLVAPLREWLSRKQRETIGGRAEHVLWERAEAWTTREESKQLPTFMEWIKIRCLTKPRKWTSSQRLMMQHSDLQQCTRLAIVATCFMSLLTLIILQRAFDTVSRLKQIEYATVPGFLGDLKNRWDQFLLRPLINSQLKFMNASPDELLKYRLAKLAVDPNDRDNIDVLKQEMITAEASKISILIDQLEPRRELLTEFLWGEALQKKPETLLQCACGLAKYDPENEQRWKNISVDFANSLVKVNPVQLNEWIKLAEPASKHLIDPLKDIVNKSDELNIGSDSPSAILVLSEILKDNFDELHRLVLGAKPHHLAALHSSYSKHNFQAIKKLNEEIKTVINSEQSISSARQGANAIVMLMKLGSTSSDELIDDFLRINRNSENIAQFIHRIQFSQIPLSEILRHVKRTYKNTEPNHQLHSPERNHRLYAFILALGDYKYESISNPDLRSQILEELFELHENHPSRSVHSALNWTLRKWNQSDRLRQQDSKLSSIKPSSNQEWYVVGIGKTAGKKVFVTMIMLDRIPFGDDPNESQKADKEIQVAVCDREVHWSLFELFRNGSNYNTNYKPNEPVFGIGYKDAVDFCKSASKYSDNQRDFQLPTKSEWIRASLMGLSSIFSFGNDKKILGDYAWYNMNSSDKVHEIGALRPSISGLFDQHGNSLEWTSSDPSNRNLFEEGEVKILCGGSYRNVDTKCGARILFQEKITSNFEDYGFRLAQHWETQDE